MKSMLFLLLVLVALNCCFAKKGDKEGKGKKCKAKAMCKEIEELKAAMGKLENKIEEMNAPKPCIPNPCKNDGTCKDLGENKFECTCKAGFEGADCSTEPSAFRSGSEILHRPEDVKQLAEYLKPVEINGREWKLCFRASENSFSSSSFHTHCDNKGAATVTLIRVGRNVFGGYNDKPWHSNAAYTHSSHAFLFSLDNHLGTPLKMATGDHPEYAIYGNTGYGPTFGGGHDLYIADQCHVNTNSYTNLGYSYRLPSGYTYGSTQSNELLAGLYQFKCDDYEVFYQE